MKPSKTASLARTPASRQQYSPIRKYQRFLIDTRIAVIRAGNPRPFRGRTLGISEAGLSAVLATDLAMGEVVGLEFTLPEAAKTLRVRAIVRNRSGVRFGFEFLTLSEQQRRSITEFCNHQPLY